jgi:hypothetical protein
MRPEAIPAMAYIGDLTNQLYLDTSFTKHITKQLSRLEQSHRIRRLHYEQLIPSLLQYGVNRDCQ